MSANQRIQWLHKKISDKCYPNAFHLAERFNISHRQAQRDVDYLIHKLNAPLQYSAEHKGYYYQDPYALPMVITSDNDESWGSDLAGQDELTLSELGIIVYTDFEECIGGRGRKKKTTKQKK